MCHPRMRIEHPLANTSNGEGRHRQWWLCWWKHQNQEQDQEQETLWRAEQEVGPSRIIFQEQVLYDEAKKVQHTVYQPSQLRRSTGRETQTRWREGDQRTEKKADVLSEKVKPKAQRVRSNFWNAGQGFFLLFWSSWTFSRSDNCDCCLVLALIICKVRCTVVKYVLIML